MLITSLVLHKIKDVEASSNKTNCECKTLAYIGIILTVLSLIIVTSHIIENQGFAKDKNLQMW